MERSGGDGELWRYVGEKRIYGGDGGICVVGGG
jgi:hypothetical protein